MSTSKDSEKTRVSESTQMMRVWIDEKGFHMEPVKEEINE